MRQTAVFILIGLVLTVVLPPVGAAAESSTDRSQLEEITVTAQRRSENLQDVPISATVVGAVEQIQRNLVSLVDVAQTVPSVHIGGGTRSDDMYIRGIGSGNNASFDQSVGTFIDDIYHGRSRTSATTLLDVDRVEILKGPQSTFFGNNAIAGAFNVITNKPSNTFESWARALYGRFGRYAVEGAAGGPITDTFGVRAAVTFNGLSGWLDNINTGRHVPRENNEGGRVTFRFAPSDELAATLKMEGSRDRNSGALAVQGNRCPPPAPFVPAGYCKTVIGLGLVPYLGLDRNFSIESPGQGIRLDTSEYVLTVNYQKWNHTFTSVSGFYDYHFLLDLDADATPLVQANNHVPENYHQFSQELRVASPAGQPIEYLAGAYFQTDDLDYHTETNAFLLTPTIRALPPFAPLVPYLPLGQDTEVAQVEHSYAVFGSLSWNATERLKLTAGLRGSWDNKSFDYANSFGTGTQDYGGIVPLPGTLNPLPVPASGLQALAGALGLGPAGTASGSRADHATLPSAKIQYRIDPTVMAYASYAKGFKAGGFNGADTSGNVSNLPFNPEHVNAYEVGLKSEWLDKTLLLNLAAFRGDYSDLQVTQTVPSPAGAILSLVRNAATSRSEGVEVEAQWAASEVFHLSGNVAYDHAYYVNYTNVGLTQDQRLVFNRCVAANPPATTAKPGPVCTPLASQDLSGQPTSFAPKWSGNLTGTYRFHLPRGYHLTAEADGIFSSSYFTNTGLNDPTLKQASYVRVDGRLTLETPDSSWLLDVIGKNLTDRDIRTFALPWPNSLGSTVIQKEMPRTVAAQVRYRW